MLVVYAHSSHDTLKRPIFNWSNTLHFLSHRWHFIVRPELVDEHCRFNDAVMPTAMSIAKGLDLQAFLKHISQ